MGTTIGKAIKTLITGTPESEKPENVIVSQRNPWYNDTIADSGFFRNSYLGGRHYLPIDYIYKHTYEGSVLYAERIKRAYYVNYIAGSINLFLAALFKEKTLARTNEDEEFSKDVDGDNTPINHFFREAARWAMIEDIAYILVDRPRVIKAAGIATKAQEQEAKVAPRFVLLRKDAVLDWVLDSQGCVSVKFRQEVKSYNDLTQKRGADPVYHYIIWNRKGWKRYDENGIQLKGEEGERETKLGVVPIVELYAEQAGKWRGLSWIRDIAKINQAVFNLDSEMDEFLFMNALAMLCLQADSPAESEGVIKGNATVITYPRNSAAPSLLVADQGPYNSLKDKQQDLLIAIYRLFKVRLLNPSATAIAASGESKAQDYIATNQTLADLADNIEACENECHKMRALWETDGNEQAAKDKQTTADYPDNFNIVAIEDEIKHMLDLAGLQRVPPTLLAEKMKDLARKLLPKHPKMDIILEEIDILAGAKAASDIVETATSGADEEPEPEEVNPEREGFSHA